jgi:hypothetical protein
MSDYIIIIWVENKHSLSCLQRYTSTYAHRAPDGGYQACLHVVHL